MTQSQKKTAYYVGTAVVLLCLFSLTLLITHGIIHLPWLPADGAVKEFNNGCCAFNYVAGYKVVRERTVPGVIACECELKRDDVTISVNVMPSASGDGSDPGPSVRASVEYAPEADKLMRDKFGLKWDPSTSFSVAQLTGKKERATFCVGNAVGGESYAFAMNSYSLAAQNGYRFLIIVKSQVKHESQAINDALVIIKTIKIHPKLALREDSP